MFCGVPKQIPIRSAMLYTARVTKLPDHAEQKQQFNKTVLRLELIKQIKLLLYYLYE